MEKEQVKQLQGSTAGTLRISEEVLATIATKAATGIEGVAALKSGKANVNPTGKPGKKEKKKLFQKFDRPVRIEMSEDEAVLDLYLIVKYGANIRTVSEKVQQAVKDDVQTMTGISVAKVNIHIEDIMFEESV